MYIVNKNRVESFLKYQGKGPYILEWPMLWRITKNSLHSEGTCKWLNWAPIFFWYELLPTTSGPQKIAKIGVVKVEYFDLPGKIFEKLVWIRC